MKMYLSERAVQLSKIVEQHWKTINEKDIARAKEGVFVPEIRRTPEIDIISQFEAINGERVKALIREGENELERLLSEMSKWNFPIESSRPKITFLGMRITTSCNYKPRCLYCDQKLVRATTPISVWKETVDAATMNGERRGIYMSVSGGEPLTAKEKALEIIRYSSACGGVVNLNTNASLITPELALRIITTGIAAAHISLDSCDAQVHNSLAGDNPVFKEVLYGLSNLQLARDIAKVSYPITHINVVATKQNLLEFDDLFSFLLNMRRVAEDLSQGNTHTNPMRRDLIPHLIPMGGDANRYLRPSVEDWKQFYESIWPRCREMWENYQASLGITETKRTTLEEHAFFINPLIRAKRINGPLQFLDVAEDAKYALGALSKQCYAAPTQAYILPNGEVYWCSAQADAGARPLGNINSKRLSEIIEDNMPAAQELPNEYCTNCLGSTLVINQAVEKGLTDIIQGYIREIRR